ncbi:MAG TPA: hypothetical protein VJU82_13090 [Acidobacteriaceae bacterium]|nr:hypothetical protein [Acidobacteriaceae bacterium]
MTQPPPTRPNGPVAAAVFACGFGCLLLGLLAVLADGSKRLATLLIFYKPTGPLSGVTTAALAGWLICWVLLASRWKHKDLNFRRVSAFAFVFLAIAFLLTFPPIGDFLIRR